MFILLLFINTQKDNIVSYGLLGNYNCQNDYLLKILFSCYFDIYFKHYQVDYYNPLSNVGIYEFKWVNKYRAKQINQSTNQSRKKERKKVIRK